jgi:hypothetical protein
MAFLARGRTTFLARGTALLLLVTSLGPGLDRACAQDAPTREYQIKAAFLLNFVQFVKWPPVAFSTPGAPFKIGILGDDPFGPALDETIRGETVSGHPLSVVRSRRLDDLRDCQMIFIARSEEGQLDQILEQLKGTPVLTVSELDGFANEGGDIDFYLSEDKVRFAINPQSARQNGLKISSQLLALAKIVQP